MPDIYGEVPPRAMAVFAHPDDAEMACGGTLAKWASEGSLLTLVVCAKGDKGSDDPAADLVQLEKTRKEEALRGSECLGVKETIFLGIPDGEIEADRNLIGRLVEIIRFHRPEVLICPDPTAIFFGQAYYNHRDHRMVGWATLDAASPSAANPLYFPKNGYMHSVSLALMTGTLEPDICIDISNEVETKAKAVSCHETQIGADPAWVEDVIRQRGREFGQKVGFSYGEGFRKVRFG